MSDPRETIKRLGLESKPKAMTPPLPEGIERLMPVCSIPHPQWCPACVLRREIAAALLEAEAHGMMKTGGEPYASVLRGDASRLRTRAAAIRRGDNAD